jgi:hypothetical protein
MPRDRDFTDVLRPTRSDRIESRPCTPSRTPSRISGVGTSETGLLQRLALRLAPALIPIVAGPAPAADRYVPEEYPTIQQAIDASDDGDVVIVAPGTYYETIDFLGKAILVRSEQGPEATVIDAGGLGDAVASFSSGEGLDSVLEGFELREGTGSTDVFWARGGGVYIRDASATIRDCLLRENVVTTDGGGLYVALGEVVLENVRFESNATKWYNGGGIYADDATILATGCEFVANHTNGSGGATILKASSATYIDCSFVGNTADRGGALKFDGAEEVVVENCTFIGNQSAGWGGAMQGTPQTLTIRSSDFISNIAGGEGGAIDSDGGALFVEHCQFIGNECLGRGGGICRNGSGTVVRDTTFEGNIGHEGEGGGLSIAEGGPYEVRRCVFRGNASHRGAGLDGRSGGPDAVIANCRFEGNEATLGVGGGARIVGGGRFVSNTLIRNRSSDRGGGVLVSGGDAEVTGCLFVGNLAVWSGGGADVRDGQTPVRLSTFLGNGAGESCGGVYGNPTTLVANCVLVANHAPHRGQAGEYDDDTFIDVRHSIVDGGYPGPGNLDVDPALVDRIGPDGIAFSGDEDLRATACGGGIGLGDPAERPADGADLDEDGDRDEPLPLDLLGRPRLVGEIDLGAYELQETDPVCASASDCNGNGIRDEVDLAACDGAAWCLDCNANGRPDECDLVPSAARLDPGIAYWRFESPGESILPEGPFPTPGLVIGAEFDADVPVTQIPANGLSNLVAFEVGESGRIRVEDPHRTLALGNTDFTIEAWIRLDELGGMQSPAQRQYLLQRKPLAEPGRRTDYAVLAQSGNSPQSADRRFGKTSGLSGREISIQFGTNAELWCVTSFLEVETTGWHFISVAHRAGEDQASVRFGLDGVFEEITFEPEYHMSWTAPLVIGAHTNSSGTYNQRLRGAIDELRISRRVLPVGELLDRRPYGATADCNANGVPDDCDIATGALTDDDGDGLADECGGGACAADLDGDGVVDGIDLGTMFAAWGGGGPADLDGSGVVDGIDLGMLFAAWGECSNDPCADAVCDDGLACTIDVCDPATGACIFIPIEGCEPDPCENVVCDDANHCTTDFCDGETGECVFLPIEGCEPFICGSPSAGDCGAANGTPACSDLGCCKAVCAFDAFCCDVEWDDDCAELAMQICP